VRQHVPTATVEVLTSDFAGNQAAWGTVLAAQPDIFNYNLETVRSLTPRVRHKATYERTLELLHYVYSHRQHSQILVKSGLMLGLGETIEEVKEAIDDLHASGCDIVTIGQYLQSSPRKLRVKAFITPQQFDAYTAYGNTLGIKHMYCGPFVRSSYNADSVLEAVRSVI
jgi:lipoic acid synthetase